MYYFGDNDSPRIIIKEFCVRSSQPMKFTDRLALRSYKGTLISTSRSINCFLELFRLRWSISFIIYEQVL